MFKHFENNQNYKNGTHSSKYLCLWLICQMIFEGDSDEKNASTTNKKMSANICVKRNEQVGPRLDCQTNRKSIIMMAIPLKTGIMMTVLFSACSHILDY